MTTADTEREARTSFAPPAPNEAPPPSRAVLALATLASGTLYYLGTGLHGSALPVWLAPIPLLVVAFRASARTAAACAFVAWVLGGLSLVPFLARVAPIPVVAVGLAVQGIALALTLLAARRAARRLPAWLAALAFPAAWTTYEFLLSLVSPHGTFGSLAYTQAGFLPLVQISSVTGIWGIVFVLALVPSGLALAWDLRARARRAASALVLPAALTIGVLAFGLARIRGILYGDLITVGLAAADANVPLFETTDASRALPALEGYARRVSQLAQAGARLVVLPEKMVGVAPAYADTALAILRGAARTNGVWLVAGLNRTGTPEHRNVAVVIARDGRIVGEYDKQHFIPGLEVGYRRGTKPGVFDAGRVRTGVAICKDMDFPRTIRRYGEAGATLMVVPAWDFVDDAELHARMAILRGVEDGFTLVRSAQQGLLSVTDAYGQPVAVASSGSSPDALLRTDVPLGPGRTIYARTGDWFAWVTVAVCVLLLALPVVARRRDTER